MFEKFMSTNPICVSDAIRSNVRCGMLKCEKNGKKLINDVKNRDFKSINPFKKKK